MARQSRPSTVRKPADLLSGYTPARLAQRHDGWTAERQRIFLTVLAETGRVTEAARAAGMSPRSAYRLRWHPQGEAFAKAWIRALYIATRGLAALAFERATTGTVREYWKNGALVGETRQPSDRLLIFLLQRLAPETFSHGSVRGVAAASESMFPDLLDALEDVEPDTSLDPDEPAGELPGSAPSPSLAHAGTHASAHAPESAGQS